MNLKFSPNSIFKSIYRHRNSGIPTLVKNVAEMKQLRFAAGVFFVTSLATILNTIASSVPALANQCIYNQAGYVARVKWYRPGDIEITRDTNGNIAAGLKDAQVKPVTEKQITLGRESCTNTDQQLLAVVSIVGGKYAKTAAEVSIGGLVAGGVAVFCGATGGAGCIAGAAAAGVVVDGFARTALPDAKEVFYVDIPPAFQKRRFKQDLRLIIFGTVFNPRVRFGAILK
jgi:hypothetical protein